MLTRRTFVAATLALVGGLSLSMASPAAAQTAIKFTLDWRFEGQAAGFFVALDKGYFKEQGLDVTIDPGNGSVEAIPRVASGGYQLGFGDINSLIRDLDADPAQKVKAVMMVYDKPVFSIVGRKSLGITEDPKSVEGKRLGAPPPDGAFAQWPVFKAAAGIDDSAITIRTIAFPEREQLLAKGEVDAVFGFAFSVVLSLRALGVPADDIVTILFADHGLDLYGNAILVNTDFAAANPEAVKGFLKAVAKGFADAVADPAVAAAAVIAHDNALDPAVETERLRMAIDMNIRTPYVVEHGMGDVDMAKLAASIETLKTSMGLTGAVTAADVFDPRYLPPKEERMLP